jgi:hypothetical protein
MFVTVDCTHVSRSVTRSRDAQGLGLAADATPYLRALLRRPLGALAPGPASRALLAYGDVDKHPHAHNPPGRTPPAREGTGSKLMRAPSGQGRLIVSSCGREETSPRRRPPRGRQWACLGRVRLWRSHTNSTPRNIWRCGRVMATQRGYGAHKRPVALCAWVGQPK